jgi:hypothetical protein
MRDRGHGRGRVEQSRLNPGARALGIGAAIR